MSLSIAFTSVSWLPSAAVFFAGLVFGLIPAAAKIFMATGITVLPLCLFYVLFRVLWQLPIAYHYGALRIRGRTQWKILLLFGFVGGTLRLAELVGIQEGLSVSVVSFLVYSHPLWAILFTYFYDPTSLNRAAFVKLALALFGILCVTEFNLTKDILSIKYLGPIVAGLCVALWVFLSSIAQAKGCSRTSVSFYYDFFSLIFLAVLAFGRMGPAEWSSAVHWMGQGEHFLAMAIFALLTGVLPNYLFYWGARYTSTMTSSLILLFEPVMASIVSCLIWKDKIGPLFFIGAGCILLTNLTLAQFLASQRAIARWLFGLASHPEAVARGIVIKLFSEAIGSEPEPKRATLVSGKKITHTAA